MLGHVCECKSPTDDVQGKSSRDIELRGVLRHVVAIHAL